MSGHDNLVLVIGGSSGTGRAIVELLSRRRIRTRVLTRNPTPVSRWLPAGVNVIEADLTAPETLPRAVDGAAHIILTAGVYSGRPATDSFVRATEYTGVLNVLAAARALAFSGRFLYM